MPAFSFLSTLLLVIISLALLVFLDLTFRRTNHGGEGRDTSSSSKKDKERLWWGLSRGGIVWLVCCLGFDLVGFF